MSMNNKLYQLNKEIWLCRKCPRFNFVSMPGYFPDKLEVLFIGRNPGQLHKRTSGWDDNLFVNLWSFDDFQKMYMQGLFEAPLGKYINSLVRDTIVWGLTNICKCRTPDNLPLAKEEIETCRQFLIDQILLSKPKIIVTFGAASFNWWFPNKVLEQYVNDIINIRLSYSNNSIPLIPLYHPASFNYDLLKIKDTQSVLYKARERYV